MYVIDCLSLTTAIVYYSNKLFKNQNVFYYLIFRFNVPDDMRARANALA